MIEIRPDPDHPLGGFALITLEDMPETDGPVSVAVLNSYQGKWLGPAGWQPERVDFPARSASRDGGRLTLVVGPDIVNHIEEGTPVRIAVGSREWDTYWPDDINEGPDEAQRGDIDTGRREIPKEPKPVVVPVAPAVQPSAPPPPPVPPVAEEPEFTVAEDDLPEDDEKSRMSLVLWGIAALLAIGAGAWFILSSDTSPGSTAAVSPQPPREETGLTRCSISVVREIAGGFAAQADRIRECAGEMTADDALLLVERGVADGDAEALRLLGTFYDEDVDDPALEQGIGLTFPDDPARAVEYYFRAQAAGSSEASELLGSTCERLASRTDTLSQSAIEEYCSR